MSDAIRVLILGTGRIGSGLARLVLDKDGLALAGAFGRRASRAGQDLGPAIGLDRDLGMTIDRRPSNFYGRDDGVLLTDDQIKGRIERPVKPH